MTPLAPASPEAMLSEQLSRRFIEWKGRPLRQHATAVLLLAVVLALRWWTQVSAPQPMNDEMVYFRAFGNTLQGLSPFERPGYLSFSLLAHLGGWAVLHLGENTTLGLLRAANLVGVSTVAWCSTAWVPWSLRRRWAAAAIFLVLAPAVRFGVVLANLSLMVSGMIILGLVCWPTRPVSAGTLLGVSVIAKPLAPGAIVALLAHRPTDRNRAHLLAGGLAAALTAVIALGSPELERAIALDPWQRLSRSVAPHRIGHLLQLDWSPFWISVLIALLTVAVARRRERGPIQLLALAVVAAVAMVPIVWSHTLLVTMPLQALVLIVAVGRLDTGSIGTLRSKHRGAPVQNSALSEPNRPRLLELVLVVLLVLALQLSEGATNLHDQSAAVQWLGALPPILAPWLLLGYFYRHTTTC